LGEFELGGHGWDSSRNLIYGHLPGEKDEPPSLTIFDSDNLTVRERFQLSEGLSGKALMSGDGQVLFGASDSGVTVFPVGSLAQQHRLASTQESLLFRSNACENKPIVQDIDIVDPGGGATDFRLATSALGVVVTPSSGVTPAHVRIEVDPVLYQTQRGTTEIPLEISSRLGVNLPLPIKLLVNTREPDQRGTLVKLPGQLVDCWRTPSATCSTCCGRTRTRFRCMTARHWPGSPPSGPATHRSRWRSPATSAT
jgi:hypothetical protein